MPKSRIAGRACNLALRARCSGLAAILILSASPCRAALTGADRLAVVYESILSAEFDRAETQIRQTCPPAPAQACAVLEVVALWWRIQIDPDNHTRDRQLNDRADAAIKSAEAWTKRDRTNPEAWFYLAGSYAPLVEWQALRGERIGAARNANRVREALEHALELDPRMEDAHFGIGLYQYYADVASPAAKMMRWLLFLPGGDRVKGLAAIDRTRSSGQLLRGEADFQRYLIDIWYEHQPADAIAILRSLDARYPTNPIFLQRIAEVYDVYLHDRRSSAETWQTLLDRARHARVYDSARIISLAERKRRALF